MNKVCNRSKSWNSWDTLSLSVTAGNSSVFLSYTVLSRHDGVLGPLVTDKAVVPKLLTSGVSKYLFYPKTLKESSSSPLEKQDIEYEFLVELNKAEQLSSHCKAIKQHCGVTMDAERCCVLQLTHKPVCPVGRCCINCASMKGDAASVFYSESSCTIVTYKNPSHMNLKIFICHYTTSLDKVALKIKETEVIKIWITCQMI